MARYLLIEIDDNETAGDLVAALDAGDQVFYYKKDTREARTVDGAGVMSVPEYKVVPLDGARPVGLFAKPVKFCDCPNPGDRSARGERFGWWVHADCGKPKVGVAQHPRNLLEPADHKPAPKDRWGYLGIYEPRRPITREA